MLLIETQHELTRRSILDIHDRLLSGFKEDGICRLLCLIKDPNTPESMRFGLMLAVNWLEPLHDTKRAIVELKRWL